MVETPTLDARGANPQVITRAFGSARAYGHATLQSGFAFARAGATCVTAVVGAGVETVAAFVAAHDVVRSESSDEPAA
jgi:hypothetical protein